jgi:hypothetical protein
MIIEACHEHDKKYGNGLLPIGSKPTRKKEMNYNSCVT